MIITPFTKKIKRLWFASQRIKRAGFTLTELLVSMIIGSFLVVLLLSFVIHVTQINSQDAGRSQVQQDMQAAMDYITQDLREAVFVYNGECLEGNGTPSSFNDLGSMCPGIVKHIPTTMTEKGRTPVLAFWRTERLPQAIQNLCSAQAGSLDATDANGNPTNSLVLAGVPCLSGTSYSLVVYALDPSNDGNVWQGDARIIRYKLSQFKDDAANENDQNKGYINPLNSPDATFQQWPYGSKKSDRTFADLQATDAKVPGLPDNSSFVLVDFVDNDKQSTVDVNACEEFAPDASTVANALSPRTGAIQGFFACVRNGGMGAAAGSGENQDILLSLIGNVTGTQGSRYESYASANRLAPLQTRVMVRGVVKKVNPT